MMITINHFLSLNIKSVPIFYFKKQRLVSATILVVYNDLSLLLGICLFFVIIFREKIDIYILSSRLLGDVFLIYCKNKGSRSLPKDEFYNTSLQSINQRPILSTLSNKKRVLTIYDTLYPQQVKLLEDRFKQLES